MYAPGNGPSGGSQVLIGNVGDAGAMVARGDTVVFSSPPQQHEFNCPYQLGWRDFYPESDTAADAQEFTVEVERGDALIMGRGLHSFPFPLNFSLLCPFRST